MVFTIVNVLVCNGVVQLLVRNWLLLKGFTQHSGHINKTDVTERAVVWAESLGTVI